MLILLPVKTDPVLEKRYSKKNLVSLSSFNGSKIVFTLLIEVVALYVGLFTVYVWGTGFQKFISRFLKGGRGSDP